MGSAAKVMGMRSVLERCDRASLEGRADRWINENEEHLGASAVYDRGKAKEQQRYDRARDIGTASRQLDGILPQERETDADSKDAEERARERSDEDEAITSAPFQAVRGQGDKESGHEQSDEGVFEEALVASARWLCEGPQEARARGD